MAEKMPSSVKLGSRPMICRMRWYSSGLSPWAAIRSSVMAGSVMLSAILSLSLPPGLGRCLGQGRGREKGQGDGAAKGLCRGVSEARGET
jgi:hypothetical protein